MQIFLVFTLSTNPTLAEMADSFVANKDLRGRNVLLLTSFLLLELLRYLRESLLL